VPIYKIGTAASFGFRYGRDFDKFEKVTFNIQDTGSPIVTENTLPIVEPQFIDTIDLGTYTIFVGDVVNSKQLKKGTPLSCTKELSQLRIPPLSLKAGAPLPSSRIIYDRNA
jgi:flavin reductase (DIM6/NTAB) family NADH-FMN oxidoreductase RutF